MEKRVETQPKTQLTIDTIKASDGTKLVAARCALRCAPRVAPRVARRIRLQFTLIRPKADTIVATQNKRGADWRLFNAVDLGRKEKLKSKPNPHSVCDFKSLRPWPRRSKPEFARSRFVGAMRARRASFRFRVRRSYTAPKCGAAFGGRETNGF